MRLRLLYLALVPPLLLAFCLQISAKDNWIRIQSKHFTVIGDANEGSLRKVTAKLEQFREALMIMFPKLGVDASRSTTVIIFKSDDAFRPYKPRYKGKIREQVGGYFLERPDGNYIVFTNEEHAGVDPYEIIFHEYEHSLVHQSLFRIPPWLDEGLAEFYSSFETSEKDQKATLGNPISRHVFYLRENHILPLKTLLTVDRTSPQYNESSKAGVFYAESWALIHYLVLGNNQKRQAQLIKFIDLVQSDVPTEESFRQAFQVDYEKIEEELRDYLTKRTYPVVNITFKQQLNVDRDFESRPLPEAEVEYYLGELLLNMSRPEEAETHFQKSMSLDATYAPGRVSLGVIRLRQGKLPEAKELLEAAIRIDPKNYLAHYFYAQALSDDKQPDEAIKHYRESIVLKPTAGFVYLNLGYAYLGRGQETEAIDVLGRGVAVDPRNPLFYRTLAYLFLQRAQGKVAVYDAETYLKIRGWLDEHSQYMALTKYFGLRQMDQSSNAIQFLEEATPRMNASEWPYPVIQYLRRKLTIEQLLAQATDNDKLTEAHAYAGLEFSRSGDRAAALDHLHWVKENGNKNFVEYPLALAEIARIEGTAINPP
jgi:tetratricopeptide (TPR) repeat protein